MTPIMNWKQKIVMWAGIIAFSFIGVSPPTRVVSGLPERRGGRVGPLPSQVDTGRLLAYWSVVVAATVGLLVTFKDKKKD